MIDPCSSPTLPPSSLSFRKASEFARAAATPTFHRSRHPGLPDAAIATTRTLPPATASIAVPKSRRIGGCGPSAEAAKPSDATCARSEDRARVRNAGTCIPRDGTRWPGRIWNLPKPPNETPPPRHRPFASDGVRMPQAGNADHALRQGRHYRKQPVPQRLPCLYRF